ncbi:hypothetical protein, partial [Microbispora hainanensis]
MRLRRRAEPGGHPPGLHRRPQRARQVVPGEVVMGQLGGGAAAFGEQRGERGVQAGALARQQVVVDGLLEERVPEGVAVAARREQPLRDDLAQRVLQRQVAEPGRVAQQVVPDPAAGHRGDPQHLAGGVRQGLHPGEQ